MFRLLSKAFSEYELELPFDVYQHVMNHLQNSVHLCCKQCNMDLLDVSVIKPFVKNVSTYYKVFHGNVFTHYGMLTRVSENESEIDIASCEDTIVLDNTPEYMDICGINVKNEIIIYNQRNWYKCLYSENDNDFHYLCAHCFLFHSRKLRKTFEHFRDLKYRV